MKCFEDLISCDLSYKVQYIELPWWVPGMRGRKRVFRPTHYWVHQKVPLLFLSHLMRKYKRTFWPTQENQKRKDKFEFQNPGWNSVLLVFNIFKLTQSLYSPRMKLWDIFLINWLIFFLGHLEWELPNSKHAISILPNLLPQGAIQRNGRKEPIQLWDIFEYVTGESYAYSNWICISCGSQFGR